MNSEFKIILEKIENTLKTSLPESTNKTWQEDSFGKIDTCINDSHISTLLKPCNQLLNLGGKRWRPLLLVLCAQMTAEVKNKKNDIEKAYSLTPLVEFAHTASLIHDDIEDGADERRGFPCSYITYGTDVAINAASWLYFESICAIKKINTDEKEKLRLYELFLNELRLLHLGQAMDIKWHKIPDLIPTIDEYTAMVRNKTGTLARLAVKIGILAGGGTEDEIEKAGAIAQDIGVGFQIIDDVKNLTTGNPGKKRGDDIVEGKKSLPVLMHITKNPSDKQLLCKYFAQAKKEGISSTAVEKAIELLTKSEAIEQARKKGNALVQEKTRELSNLFAQKTKYGELILELFVSMLCN